MGTRPKRTRVHYFIKEWIEHLQLSDDDVAKAVGVTRSTIWKWNDQQHRLSPDKIERLAEALGRHPAELVFPPGIPSLDAIADGVEMDIRSAMIADVARRVPKTH